MNQTISDSIEILCIGDKVDDPTHAIVQEYANKHPDTIQLHLQDGRGIGGARNLGLDLAKGEYIMFSDADDYVSPEILEKCESALIKNGADFVCVGFERVTEAGNRLSSELTGAVIDVIELNEINIPRLAFIYTAPWGKLFRRDLIGSSRFTDDPISAYEDLMFHLSIYLKVKKYVQLPEILYHYIVYPESSISTVSQERTQTFRRDLASVKQQYLTGGSTAYLRMLDVVAIIHVGIADAHRTAEDRTINLRTFCKGAKAYLNENFPDWKKIKLRPYGRLTLRCILVWKAKILYKMNVFWFFIRIYNLMIKTLHIDIKW